LRLRFIQAGQRCADEGCPCAEGYAIRCQNLSLVGGGRGRLIGLFVLKIIDVVAIDLCTR
jgi:hypothetical protein